MKRFKKNTASILLILALLIGLVGAPVSANETTEKVNYLSLGDSLAAGMYYGKQIGAGFDGYSDFVKKHFEEKGTLGTYSKAFAFPAYKLDNVLADLQSKEDLQDAIKKSNLITVSAGANDLLSLAKYNPQTQMLEIDQAKIMPTLSEIGAKYTQVLKKIAELNKDTEVYVMGYYFPYPHINAQQKPQLIVLAHLLNNTLKAAAEANGAVFVDVYSKFGDDTSKYLPVPMDIHPNAEGYKLMSEVLLETIEKNNAPKPDPEPIQVKDIKGHWAEIELQALVDKGLLTPDKDGKVYPNQGITRAEVAVILYKATNPNKPAIVIPDPGFKDVSKTHPAYEAIAYLTLVGVFSKADKFNPNNTLERFQLAKVVAKTYKLKIKGKPIVFKDVPKNYHGYDVVQAVATNKLMNGEKNGNFNLYGKTTRAQFAAVAVRALQSVGK